MPYDSVREEVSHARGSDLDPVLHVPEDGPEIIYRPFGFEGGAPTFVPEFDCSVPGDGQEPVPPREGSNHGGKCEVQGPNEVEELGFHGEEGLEVPGKDDVKVQRARVCCAYEDVEQEE